DGPQRLLQDVPADIVNIFGQQKCRIYVRFADNLLDDRVQKLVLAGFVFQWKRPLYVRRISLEPITALHASAGLHGAPTSPWSLTRAQPEEPVGCMSSDAERFCPGLMKRVTVT